MFPRIVYGEPMPLKSRFLNAYWTIYSDELQLLKMKKDEKVKFADKEQKQVYGMQFVVAYALLSII